jgi:hypothetical protein
MGWPQITMIVLLALGVGIALAKNGQSKGNYSFGWAIIGAGINVGLLYAGGFFS